MEKLTMNWIGRLTLGVTAVCITSGAPQDDGKKLQDLMQRKLKHAQKILEGVALKDFALIGRSAEELTLVSKAAEFQAVKSPPYEIYSNEFRRLAESLAKQSKEKNLDGAALSYVELTLNCVKCHKYVREVRMTRNEIRYPSSTEIGVR